MANGLYDTGRNAFLLGAINWVADDVRLVLIDTDFYTADLATDQFLSIVPAPARVAMGTSSLANKTASAGVADADDFTFSSVSGLPVKALLIYRHTGDEATSQLIAYIDDATGLILTPVGNDVVVQWPGGPLNIFRL